MCTFLHSEGFFWLILSYSPLKQKPHSHYVGVNRKPPKPTEVCKDWQSIRMSECAPTKKNLLQKRQIWKKHFYITFKMLKMDRLKSKHPDSSKKSFNKTVILLCDTSGQKDWNFNPIISIIYLTFENALETLFQVLHSPTRPYQLKAFDCFVKLVNFSPTHKYGLAPQSPLVFDKTFC